MKRLLGLSLPVVLLMVGCKKDTDPTPPPTETISPAVSFSQTHYGLEQLNTNGDITSIMIQKVPAGRTFSYEITAANGLKNAADSIIKGRGKTVTGNTEIEIEQYLLYKYKDGDLYLTVKLDSTGETAKDTVLKDEYVVRTYADMQKINPNSIERVNVLKGADAVKKYGAVKAVNGVIEIVTKTNVITKVDVKGNIRATVADKKP